MSTLDDIQARADAATEERSAYVLAMRSQRDVPKLVGALRAVEAVHKKAACCGEADCAGVAECSHCHYNWPCTTIRQIWEALGDA